MHADPQCVWMFYDVDWSPCDAPYSVRALMCHAMCQVALGMHFLHSYTIVHRDLTSSNIMLDSILTAKVCSSGYVTHVLDCWLGIPWHTVAYRGIPHDVACLIMLYMRACIRSATSGFRGRSIRLFLAMVVS